MQMDKNNMKIEKSISMHSHAFERLCKRQIVTDPKLHNALHIVLFLLINLYDFQKDMQCIVMDRNTANERIRELDF